MKTLLIVNGPMGVGKSATCRHLLELLQPAAYLDGDWCWNVHPFAVSKESRRRGMDNIAHLLAGYLDGAAVDAVIFGWVMHRQTIFDELLGGLGDRQFRLQRVTLVCSPEVLRARLMADVEAGLRDTDIIARSLERLAQCAALDTPKLDVGTISPEEAARRVAAMIR